MTDPIDIVERLSGMSADHGPDGWPAVPMRDITALCDEVRRLRAASALPSVPQEPAPEMLQVARGGNEGWGDEGVAVISHPHPRPRPRSTHTLAGLPVTTGTWNEIANKLREAGYGHAFTDEGIDMSGIMLYRN